MNELQEIYMHTDNIIDNLHSMSGKSLICVSLRWTKTFGQDKESYHHVYGDMPRNCFCWRLICGRSSIGFLNRENKSIRKAVFALVEKRLREQYEQSEIYK